MADFTQEALREALDAMAPRVFCSDTSGGQQAVVVPDGYKVAALPTDEQLLERPRRLRQRVVVGDPASFIRYFRDFRESGRIFADQQTGKFLGVLDYHDAPMEAAIAQPRWCAHRVELTLRKSDEWTAWSAQNGKQVSQDAFALFIEDNSPDIVRPEPAHMLEIARTISASGEINCDSAVRTNEGVRFKYNEVTKGVAGVAGQFTIPEEFYIRIPMYVGSPLVEIKARFRWRINGGKLALSYDLWRWAAIERAAFESLALYIGEATENAVINGTMGQ